MNTQPVSPGAYTLNNDPEEIAYRRACSTLVSVGRGVLIFMVWSVVKTLGIILINRRQLMESIRNGIEAAGGGTVSDGVIYGLIASVLAGYLLAVLAFRTYISVSAISEGRGRQVFFLYIPLSILYIVNEVLTFITGFLAFTGAAGGEESTSLAALLIELTSFILLIQMVSSARKVRRYKKMITSREAGHAA